MENPCFYVKKVSFFALLRFFHSAGYFGVSEYVGRPPKTPRNRGILSHIHTLAENEMNDLVRIVFFAVFPQKKKGGGAGYPQSPGTISPTRNNLPTRRAIPLYL